MNEQLLLVIVTLIFLTGLWWLYFVEYKRYLLDATRQRLFRIRDELFQQAKNGVIAFDSKAYGLTRETLNGMIRYTHGLSFTRLLVSVIIYKVFNHKKFVDQYHQQLVKALDELSPEAKEAVLRARFLMHMTVFRHVVYNSMVLLTIYKLSYYLLIAIHRWSQAKSFLVGDKSKTKWDIVDAEAYSN